MAGGRSVTHGTDGEKRRQESRRGLKKPLHGRLWHRRYSALGVVWEKQDSVVACHSKPTFNHQPVTQSGVMVSVCANCGKLLGFSSCPSVLGVLEHAHLSSCPECDAEPEHEQRPVPGA
jgi:hypothetical protein